MLVDYFIGQIPNESPEKLPELAAHFARECLATRKVPLSFDTYFRPRSAQIATEREQKTMETFSKMHSLHIKEMVSKEQFNSKILKIFDKKTK